MSKQTLDITPLSLDSAVNAYRASSSRLIADAAETPNSQSQVAA